MSEKWFGTVHELPSSPEKPTCTAADHEVDDVFAGYAALDQRSSGKYSDFLRQAARCTRCAADKAIPSTQQPINILCGTIAEPASVRRAHEALAEYRREHGSLRVNPADGLEPLAGFLDERGLAGLSIGHCGWGDLTARLRGAQLEEGVDLMILGADWYPLTACSNFLLDRYHENDHTLARFHAELRKANPDVPTDLRELFRRHRIYLGNTLLCYRTGWSKQGEANLSRRSFEHCRTHLERHVDAIAPRVIVTFGREPARSVAALVDGKTPAAVNALAHLRRDPRVKKTMEAFYASDPDAKGLTCVRGDREVVFVPLCHPSMPNRYKGDYPALARILEV